VTVRGIMRVDVLDAKIVVDTKATMMAEVVFMLRIWCWVDGIGLN